MKNITIKDLYKYDFLSEISCNEDGTWVLFVKTQVKEETNKYSSKIFALNTKTNEVKPLTSKQGERSFIWYDNETILFQTPSANEKGKTNYFKLSLNGGEALKAFTIPAMVTSIKKIDDENYLIAIPKPMKEDKKEENRAVLGEDYVIFDELPFWFNGMGVSNKKRNTLNIFNVKTNEIKQISKDETNVSLTTLSPCKTKLLFAGASYTDIVPNHQELYEYHIASGYTDTLLENGTISVMKAEYIGDEILIEGSDRKNNTSQDPDIYTLSKDKKLEKISFLDGGLYSSAGSDMSYGGGKTLKNIDGELYTLYTSWGNAFLSKFTKDKKLEFVNETCGAISCFDIHGDTAYCVAFRDYEPQEIYSINLKDKTEKRLTNFSKEFTDTHTVIKPERFVFTSDEGHELEGFVIKPVNYEKGKKYKGVLSMHGGPKAAYGYIYNHEMQCLANMDYFVFYTNPRGSSGRGDKFSTLAGNLGVIDYKDFMDFTDEVIKRYPDLDKDSIGIAGGSYAGFMVNWMIGNTNRFKAACSQRSISNYFSKCLSTDIGFYHNLSQVGASPWEDYEKMWFHSPLKYVSKATTPTLFIQSDEDYRCWMSEPLQMFTTLRQNNIPSKIALFHKENHELSRSGRPHNRISRLKEICDWFEKYL